MNGVLVKFFAMVFLLVGVIGIFIISTVKKLNERKAQVEVYCQDQVEKQAAVTAEAEKDDGSNIQPVEGDSEGVVTSDDLVTELYNRCMAQNWNVSAGLTEPPPPPSGN